MRSLRILFGFVLATALLTFAGKGFTKPRAADAGAYPAHEDHPDERVSVAIDPYDSPKKAEIFKVNWKAYGYLPVYLIVTNHGDQPIALTRMKIQWVTANRSKLEPAITEELLRRLSHANIRSDEPPRGPLPIPGRGPKAGVSKEARDEIDAAQFHALAVEPHATQAGFLFFDVDEIVEPLAGAHLYVDGIRNADTHELFYFDVPVDKYLAAPAAN
jgi:hypothetical protein